MSVFISYENKKLRLKVTPATLMSSFVTQAKEHWKLEDDITCYILRNPRTKAVVDLSQPFRLTGLQPQCTLEILHKDNNRQGVKIESVESSSVRVALKCSGKLHEGKFSPDATLLTIVQTIMPALLESQISPSIQLKCMHVTYPIKDFERVTLRSIGVSSGPVCFTVDGKENQMDIANVISNQSTDADIHTHPDSISKDNHVVQQTMKEEELPVTADIGLDGCKSALHAMKKYNFDEDSRGPKDTSTRSISTTNSAFISRISSVRGGVDFLLALGFEEQATTKRIGMSNSGGGVVITSGTQASRMLVLSPSRENTALLSTARRLLASEAVEIGVNISDLPRPPQQQILESKAGTSSTVHQQAFDPYRPLVTSLIAHPNADEREESITEMQLKNLKALKNTIQDRSINNRNVTILLPKVTTTHDNNMKSSSFGNVEEHLEDTKCDSGIIAERVARQQAERKRVDKTPFQTKAMREVQHLRNKQVYSEAIIRVQFPNRIQLQASFLSTESVSAIYEVVRESLSEHFRMIPFHLYVTPPRRVLPESATLADEGLVPASVVYIRWNDETVPSEDFLVPDLLRKGKELGTHHESYPHGTRLDPSAAGLGTSGRTVEGTATAPVNQGKKPALSGKKPGWFKI